MTELEAAQDIVAGKLPSPWQYENCWLFALRITGTGMAYRKGRHEYVWRDPSLYLSDEFQARCNGLPVVWEHPGQAILNSREFAERVIGTILLPYANGDEVWGIAKIYDSDAARVMQKRQLSTSPAVVFRDPSANTLWRAPDGQSLLIEGKPTLLDHLAICELGVWDKDGSPKGVATMADETTQAGQDDKLDRVLNVLDAMCSRMDAAEKKMGDMEKRVDSALAGATGNPVGGSPINSRRDAIPTKTEVNPGDEPGKPAPTAADAEPALHAQENSAETERKLSSAMADAQARADRVFGAHATQAPPPMAGERLSTYRRRLLRHMQSHSADFGKVDLHAINDAATFDAIENRIYADAMVASRNPPVAEGHLHEVKRRDEAGRMVSTFYGSPSAWMDQFRSPTRRVVGIHKGRID